MGDTPKDRPRKPEPKPTPLDGLSNEELLAMLTPIKHERATALSVKLAGVAQQIEKIADRLSPKADTGLAWQGAGADAFLEWKDATSKATRNLADYAKLAGEALGHSATAMAGARSGVDEIAATSASAKTDYATAQRVLNAARHDPGAGKNEVASAAGDMTAAANAREKSRIEALMKLRSLGQTYTFEGQRVNDATRPVFPPPAGYLGESWVRDERSYVEVPGRSSRSDTSGTTHTYQTGDVIGGRRDTDPAKDGGVVRGSDDRAVEPAGPTRPGPTQVVPQVPDPPADLGIDSVVTPPDTRPAPTVPGPSPVRPETPAYPGGPGLLPPPPTAGPVGTPPPPITGGGPGRGLPVGRPGPLGPGATTPPRLPREPGIVGGRPMPPAGGRPATGLPRGTVVGNEQAYGRGGMGGAAGPHGVGGGSGGHGAAGRRLASEQGGVVGGRPQKGGQAGSRPFTPGGSGLVRPGQSDDDDRGQEQAGERPDYLVEDEETWQQGKRPIVPPVVD
ncbi:hypothetical protein ACIRTB_34310 [Streptomyces sp. NPDC101158]|uniref:WXG100 family type VII secretion target n=1 Tax=Streptomyces sp. NPDC101158 TaxID=3366117 RepID=UPI0037FC96BE